MIIALCVALPLVVALAIAGGVLFTQDPASRAWLLARRIDREWYLANHPPVYRYRTLGYVLWHKLTTSKRETTS
jgi:hypothetical protein